MEKDINCGTKDNVTGDVGNDYRAEWGAKQNATVEKSKPEILQGCTDDAREREAENSNRAPLRPLAND